MTEPCSPGRADVIRDAMALVRAQLADDWAGVEAVACNMTYPATTAAALAGWIAAAMRATGYGEAEIKAWGVAMGVEQG